MKPDVTTPADGEPTMKQLMAMLLESRKTDQALAEQSLKQSKPPSNKRGPDASVYNPRGQKDYPMEPLAFEVLAPWSMQKGHNHGMDAEEVRLMNRVKPGEVNIELRDDTIARGCIIATKNADSSKIERLAFMGPRDPDSNMYSTLFTKERKQLFPSLKKILQQVLDQQGTDYSDIMTMTEMNRRILLPKDDPKYLPISLGE